MIFLLGGVSCAKEAIECSFLSNDIFQLNWKLSQLRDVRPNPENLANKTAGISPGNYQESSLIQRHAHTQLQKLNAFKIVWGGEGILRF